MKKTSLTLSVALSLILFAGCGSSARQKEDKKPEVATSKTVNSAPVATFSTFSINKDVRYDGELFATDADGDRLNYVIVTQPQHGTVVLHDNGCFTYTPNDGYYGVDTFSYRASDDMSSCAVKTVTVNVNEGVIQAPTAPTNLKVKALSTTKLELTWSDNSDNEEGFVIYRDGKLVGTTNANKTKKIICCGLEAGKTYNFEVKAKNAGGVSNPATAQGTTKDVTTPPNAPTELKATAVEKTSLRLKWKDNADNESGYEIYQDGVKVKTVSAGCHCAVITDLTEGTSYSFVVNAINKIGSASSNTLAVTTKGNTAQEEQLDTVAQALLGPLNGADFKITKLDDNTIIAKGKTTKGDGTDISTAGLIILPETTIQDIENKLYLIEVRNGQDVDADDNAIWDDVATDNNVVLHALVKGNDIELGDFKVNALTEIVYQNIKNSLSDKTVDQIDDLIKERSKKLLKDADKGGDVDNDGEINRKDILAWNPAYDKDKLRVDYDTVIQPLKRKLASGEDISKDLKQLFSPKETEKKDTTPPVITLQGSKTVVIKVGDTYTEAGATANDDKDGNVAVTIKSKGGLNTNKVGTYTITYEAKDKAGNKATETKKVVVTKKVNKAPIANAGADQSVKTGYTITFDGSKSSDSDGHIVKYEWLYGGRLLNSNTSKPTYSRKVTKAGGQDAEVTLRVTDDKGATSIDSMVVHIVKKDDTNKAPTASAGSDKTVTIRQSVTVSGTGIDTDGNIKSYKWSENGTTLSTQKSFSYKPTTIGTHTLTLTVTDNGGLTASDTLKVVVKEAPDNVKPIVTLKGDATVTLKVGDTYTDPGATAKDNKDGDITSKIVKIGSVNTSKVGTYTIKYEVSDKAGNKTDVTRTIIVKKTENPYKNFLTAKDNTVHDVVKEFDGHTIKVITDHQLSDSPSNSTIAVYGFINGKNTAALLKINSNYPTGTKIVVQVLDDAGTVIATSDVKETSGTTPVNFGSISF